jgi:hypothetical protein
MQLQKKVFEMKATWRRLLILSMALVGMPTVSSADTGAQPGPQPAPHVMSGFPTLYPAAYKRWRQLLPSEFAGTTWLSQFAGGSSQIRQVNVGGVTMIYGSECKRNDCGPNTVQVLASADGSKVVALATLAGGDAVLVLGSPSAVELNCLKILDGDEGKVTSC